MIRLEGSFFKSLDDLLEKVISSVEKRCGRFSTFFNDNQKLMILFAAIIIIILILSNI